MNCPECKGILDGRGSHYHCPDCGQSWKVTFTCENCGELPKVAASCGAVSFFCERCGTLKSRESMNKEFTKDN